MFSDSFLLPYASLILFSLSIWYSFISALFSLCWDLRLFLVFMTANEFVILVDRFLECNFLWFDYWISKAGDSMLLRFIADIGSSFMYADAGSEFDGGYAFVLWS